MPGREEIERVLRQAYEARKQGDVDKVMQFFHDDGRFKPVGAESAAVGCEQCASAIKGVIDNFELLDYTIHTMVIEGSKAAVFWHGRFRARPTGKQGETDLLDLVEVENGRIKSFHNFFDNALAERLMTP